MNNLDYFKVAPENREKLIDTSYSLLVDRYVIPKSASEHNELTDSNDKVIRYISSIETQINELRKDVNDEDVVQIFKLIIKEMETKGMNYSAFCQYFNVHNINYSVFSSLDITQKLEVLQDIIIPYIENRHHMYLSHGYSNIVLQVMSDNYSHKRKGSYGTDIIASCMTRNDIPRLTDTASKNFDEPYFYLLSDKSDKKTFIQFAKENSINLSNIGMTTKKYPDALIKINNDYFIVEQKNMKEGGGGQDKQTLEITSFIDKIPEFEGLHYVTFVNGIFYNKIMDGKAKMRDQYQDIINTLNRHHENYFVNTYSFDLLIKKYRSTHSINLDLE